MWDQFIIEPMINALLFIYNLLIQAFGTEHMFGLAIILFTALIRLVTLPLTLQQQKGAKAMQEMQQSKKWQELQKKYKNDKEKLGQEQIKLYQEMGINPLASCLPTLVQLPIILGLYQSITRAMADTPLPLLHLGESIYPFINSASVIPLNSHFLWMDLGQPERLTIFGVGIPVLAILVALTTYVSSKMIAMPSSNPDDQSAQMSKMMNIYMPLMLGYFAWSFASGLAVYFVASNVMSIIQYAAMGKVDWKNVLRL
jgi:YidC/Oxa1 family membrane protein insertase